MLRRILILSLCLTSLAFADADKEYCPKVKESKEHKQASTHVTNLGKTFDDSPYRSPASLTEKQKITTVNDLVGTFGDE
jgi:hypothetical protein